MRYVIRLIGKEGKVIKGENEIDLSVPTWVRRYDVDANRGRGELLATTNIRLAVGFPTMREATAYYMRQSKTLPKRVNDGRPNRPLTTFTVEIHSTEE